MKNADTTKRAAPRPERPRICVAVSPDELQGLDVEAEREGISRSDVVRRRINTPGGFRREA